MITTANNSDYIKILVTPVPKPRMTQRDRWEKRECCDRYWTYKDELLLAWGGRTLQDTFHIIFTLPMPKSWSEKKKLRMDGKPHQCRPDIDNLLKGFADCLLKEDSVLWDVRATKLWGREGSVEVVRFD